MGLFDMVMIKDNHIAAAGGIEAAVEGAREYLRKKGLDIGVEVRLRFSILNLNQLLGKICHKLLPLPVVFAGSFIASLATLDSKCW